MFTNRLCLRPAGRELDALSAQQPTAALSHVTYSFRFQSKPGVVHLGKSRIGHKSISLLSFVHCDTKPEQIEQTKSTKFPLSRTDFPERPFKAEGNWIVGHRPL